MNVQCYITPYHNITFFIVFYTCHFSSSMIIEKREKKKISISIRKERQLIHCYERLWEFNLYIRINSVNRIKISSSFKNSLHVSDNFTELRHSNIRNNWFREKYKILWRNWCYDTEEYSIEHSLHLFLRWKQLKKGLKLIYFKTKASRRLSGPIIMISDTSNIKTIDIQTPLYSTYEE